MTSDGAIELTIERLGRQGDGLAQWDGKTVRAARTLPGEVVRGMLKDGRLDSPRITTASAQRVSPPCRHYKACGGCAVQHATDGFVADWKMDQVRRALAAQGLAAPIRNCHTSPPRSRRRATLTGRRTKSGAILGFHGRASVTLVDVTDCHVLHPAIASAIPRLRDLVARVASRKAPLSLSVTVAQPGLDLVITGGRPLERGLLSDLLPLASEGVIARLTWGDEPVFQVEPPTLTFGKTRVTPPPGAFLQATQAGEQALLRSVTDALHGCRTLADLFAGCGTFALPLAKTSSVHAVEGDTAMLTALDDAWRGGTGLKPVTTEGRDLFRRPLLADELARFDGLVIDPPRAGAEAQCRVLATSGPPRIAAVSCDPATFARDAAILTAGGYRIDWIDVVDQFRWAGHVELIAALSRP